MVYYRNWEKFDQESEAKYGGEPTVNRDDHKVWKDTSVRGVSKAVHIFVSPFSRGGDSPQQRSQIGSLIGFEGISGTRINGLMLDKPLLLLNRLLKAEDALKLVSVRHEETKSGRFSRESEYYTLSR